jgi:tetratricopeptide (TPR) repeat protein
MAEKSEAAKLFEQGNEMKENGDLAGAENALRQAAEANEREVSPVASLELGELLYERGDAEGAAFEWHVAAQAPDPDVSIPAIINYARLISEYEFTPKSAESVAGTNRNAPLLGGFDPPTAEHMWLKAAQSKHPDAAWAWIGVGRVRAEDAEAREGTGDPEGAEDAYRKAAKSGHSDAAPFGLLKLGLFHRNQDQEIEALKEGFDSEHPEWAPRCAWFLGLAWAGRGVTREAERWWRIAVDSGHPGAAKPAQQALSDPDSIFRAGLPRKRGLGKLFGG